MPVTFSVKLFVRLGSIAVLIALLWGGIGWGLNSVRHEAWQERLSTPLLNWIARSPSPGQRYHWLPQLYDFSSNFPSDLGLNAIQRERLHYGQTLVIHDSLGQQAMAATDTGRVVSLRFRNLYQDLSEATALTALWHLNQSPAEHRAEASALLAEALGVGLKPISENGQLPSAEVLERAWERNLALYGGQQQQRVLLRLEDGTLMRLDMPPGFRALSWPVLLLLAGLAVLVLLVAVQLLARDLDRNLRTVESMAVRIARGDLDARVEPGRGNLVSRLAESFNGMAEQIQRLVEVQREMIHAVSHELRTPVARIRFGVQMIETARDKAALQRQLDGIDNDIQELDELIDEILTYARLEQGGPVFSLRPGSVTDIVRQVVEEQQVTHPDVEINAVIPEESEHFSESDIEPRYLHRAIQNLVGNACRYARERVEVRCLLDEDNCRIDVEDDGPGVPEQDWEKVFSAFARLDDSRTRHSGGYGLGLSIVRRILYWHGGQSFVGRSANLGGARFSLVWPRRQ
ncbi:two-component system, OmpR family, sensor histidine kinase RstB [Marinobacter daqiaonensis]|uniref:histidine kinase n=1 Tax=Marinobacter daqiaonensis TaxID=650891 RepID=A0A1I6J6Y0_9GAMM|nr:ATP-binding protein [Marinobacter daqiaonensis]SFR74756.1 two-component system, OmpR family, sensor histidine kinase RstB [Marinobacter daqiaonensis]